MNNGESLSDHDLARIAQVQAVQPPAAKPAAKSTYDNPMAVPVLVKALDDHNSRVSTLSETVERLINRLASVVDYPQPQPPTTGSPCPPPQSPMVKLYERLDTETNRLQRLQRQLEDVIDRLTV